MKVLFAVSNENITTSVISKYQQKYKEIVTSKNVYYFNAIIKELQNDKSYDAIVIGEDLEPISNNNYDVIDKFIIEKLDRISDEASKSTGEDIPITFICSDRRTKSDQLLRSLFSMGIYNALVGNDRSLDNVCSLINKPRNKKEAKKYYRIDDDDPIEYEPANEELVSEEQLRNILTYYKKIGNDERKCVQAFESISKQYNNAQLRLIIKVLPIEVKAILETRSPIYQKLMENGTVLSNGKYSPYTFNDPRQPGKLDFIEKNISTNKMTQPVIIPSNLNFSNGNGSTPINNNTGAYTKNSQSKQSNNLYESEDKRVNPVNRQNIQLPRQQNNSYYNTYNNINQQQNYNQGHTQYQSRYGTVPPYNPYNPYNSYNPYLSNYNNLNEMQNRNFQISNMPTANISTETKQKNNNDIKDQNSQNNLNYSNNQNNQNNQSNNNNQNNKNEKSEDIVSSSLQTNMPNEVATPVKKKRGRPKKNVEEEDNVASDIATKKKRGRPRKLEKLESIHEDEPIQNQVENSDNFKNVEKIDNTVSTKNIGNIEKDGNIENIENSGSIENFGNAKETKSEKIEENKRNNEVDLFNLSIDVPEKSINSNINNMNKDNHNAEEDKYAFLNSNSNTYFNSRESNDNKASINNTSLIEDNANEIQNENNNFVIAGNGKIVSFVGATKNGTSFIVNCLALLLANDGIKVAIADFTKNKNSYYLFTDNDSNKVKIAANSMKRLSDGIVEGLKIKNNLYLFTSLPDENMDEKLDKSKVLNTLSENFDIVMLDCDLQSNSTYFTKSDEIYLIQSMDVFTIQPLTKFLSDYKNVIDVNKFHIVINKYLKLKKLDFKMVIAGMSKYNDPSMALQRDLFEPKKITYNLIPFDLKTYSSYLEAIALCKININEFSNNVMDSLYELKSRVYPLVDQQDGNRKKLNSKNKIESNNLNGSNLYNPNSNIYNNSFEPHTFNSSPANLDSFNSNNLNSNNLNSNNLNSNSFNRDKFSSNNSNNNNFDSSNLNNSAFSSDINSTLNKMRNNNF